MSEDETFRCIYVGVEAYIFGHCSLYTLPFSVHLVSRRLLVKRFRIPHGQAYVHELLPRSSCYSQKIAGDTPGTTGSGSSFDILKQVLSLLFTVGATFERTTSTLGRSARRSPVQGLLRLQGHLLCQTSTTLFSSRSRFVGTWCVITARVQGH